MPYEAPIDDALPQIGVRSNCCRNQAGAPASELSHVDCWGQPRHDREHERAFFPSRRAYHSE